MKIGILGSGHVGGTLGTRWAKNGHEVIFTSRHPDSPEMKQLVQKAGSKASTASPKDAACSADLMLLSVPWPQARQALIEAGDLRSIALIDATNPLKPDLSALDIGNDTSAAEQIASWHPEIKVAKAFNTVGFNIMENPGFPDGKVFLPYCGDDADLKRKVHSLAEELGFEPFDMGPLVKARVLEPFAMLWISIAVDTRNRDFAFKMLRR
jgi:predicted dinucleotide-binding enzyme